MPLTNQKAAMSFGGEPMRQSDADLLRWTSAQPCQHLHRENIPQRRRQRQRGVSDDIV